MKMDTLQNLLDDGDYQYYNPVSVDNGVIGTIQNDEGVDSVADNHSIKLTNGSSPPVQRRRSIIIPR